MSEGGSPFARRSGSKLRRLLTCSRIYEDRLSGAKSARPGLALALEVARGGDQLVVWRLDRLGRSMSDLIELVRKSKKPVVLFVDEAHDLHFRTLRGLKRLCEVVADGGTVLSIVLAGHPKLRNALLRPNMEEIGSRIHPDRVRLDRETPIQALTLDASAAMDQP
jgi:resolvase-like protein/AAA domain-containing protein